ncbi:UDP-glucose 4-epimerase GalE [Puniceicoccaceae bacterium K14]|nr:UDP-glucose 4-epimerase GalE [Puniceicoccaceae bacterium K14]
MKVLVIGGAGYIGSHCVRQLTFAGHQPVVLDNLAIGSRQAVSPEVPFYETDLSDKAAVTEILKKEGIEIVMHFSAFSLVGESVGEPDKYYENNVVGTLRVLQAMKDVGIRKFVFSSTAATYGIPDELPITEDTKQAPINPYGQTKLDVENMLKNFSKAYGLSFAVFRYFNAAGAAEDGSIGECRPIETHLIPNAFYAAQGKKDVFNVMGTDYPTPDGTCLRDYIHVDDISRAHIASFDKLEEQGTSLFYNLGTGNPMSVKEILDAIEKVSGLKIPIKYADRRAGDPPSLYANSSKAQKDLNWTIKFKDAESIVETAWRWHKSHPDGFEK